MKERNKNIWNIIVMILVLGIGLFVGYQYHLVNDLTSINPVDFDRFREIYHNDYITTTKSFISECSQIYGNRSVVVARHWVNLNGKHLGFGYRCEGLPMKIDSLLISNKTLSFPYTASFYETRQ